MVGADRRLRSANPDALTRAPRPRRFGEPFKGRRSAARLASSASSSPLLKPGAPHAPSPFVEQPKAAAGAAPEPAMQQAAAHNIVASSGAVRAPPPSVPVPTSAPQVPQEALAVQQLPGIGTWAGRQRLFSRPADLRNVPRSPSSGSPAPLTPLGSAADAGAGPAVLRPAPAARVARGGGLLSPASSSGTEQEAREAAWRWRFSRKWEAEQKKYYEGGGEAGAPMNGSLVSNDDLEAIQYTQVGGVGRRRGEGQGVGQGAGLKWKVDGSQRWSSPTGWARTV